MKTEKNELKKLEEKVSYLASALDAAIDDYFKYDNSGETEETERIHKYLKGAWDRMDDALDNIRCLTMDVTKTGNQQGPTGTDPDEPEPEPVLTDETFRALLRALTPETAKKDLKVASEIMDWAEKIKNLNADLRPTFAAMMLIEYGKLASKKETAQAADPEGKEEG